MAIRGSLKEASLPDVLQLLSMGKKTGCSERHASEQLRLHLLRQGPHLLRVDRESARSTRRHAREERRRSRRSSSTTAVKLQDRRRDKRLGELLVEQGALTMQQLHDAIEVQIQEAVYFLFTWNQGTFNFEADVAPDTQDHVVSINPESLLLEGARRVDEWGLIEKKIPTFDLVFEMRSRQGRRERRRGDRRAARRARAGRWRRATCKRSSTSRGSVEFEVGKALYGLLNAGFIHRIGKTTAPARRRCRAKGGSTSIATSASRSIRLECSTRRCASFVACSSCAANDTVGALLHRPRARAPARSGTRRWPRSPRRPRQPGAKRRRLPQSRLHARAAEPIRRSARRARRSGAPRRRQRPARPDVARRRQSARRRSRRRRTQRSRRRVRCSASVRRRRRGSTTWDSPPRCSATRRAPRRFSTKASRRIRTRRRCSTTWRPSSSATGEYERARTIAERGVQEDAGACAQLHKNLGDLHYRAARYDEALEAYLRATKADPELGGDVYLKLGNIRLASTGARGGGALLGARARARPGQRHRSHEPRVGAPGVLMIEQQRARAAISSS